VQDIFRVSGDMMPRRMTLTEKKWRDVNNEMLHKFIFYKTLLGWWNQRLLRGKGILIWQNFCKKRRRDV